MPRRGWSELSPAYRARLERGGITQSAYESGVSLRSARGHGATPEHPGQGFGRPEFQPYYQTHVQYVPVGQIHSDAVKQRLAERITQAFGSRHKFRGVLDPDFPPLDFPPAPDDEQILETLELDDFDLEDLAREAHEGTRPEYWFLWYH